MQYSQPTIMQCYLYKLKILLVEYFIDIETLKDTFVVMPLYHILLFWHLM